MNRKNWIIPDDLKLIHDEAFYENPYVEEVLMPGEVFYIGDYAFAECKKLKRVILSDKLRYLNKGVFENCISLEEVYIPDSITTIPAGLFYNCVNLKRIIGGKNIQEIGDYAFYNCKKLEALPINEKTTDIGEKAFFHCESIKELLIPSNCKEIGYASFAYMKSLEKIEVSKSNPKYISIEDKVLANKEGSLIQYAINAPLEEYTIGYYENPIVIGENESISYELIYNISDYAFAGTKNLKKIEIPSELASIGSNTFKDCENLENLTVSHSNYGDIFSTEINKYQEREYTGIIHSPFKNIIIEEGITTLGCDLSELFKNATNVKLPDSLVYINSNVFKESTNLKRIQIPENIKNISPDTFNDNTILEIKNIGKVQSSNFNMLQSSSNNYDNEESTIEEEIKIYSLKDGTYYLKIGDYEIITITKEEIDKLSEKTSTISTKPFILIDYLSSLLQENAESHYLLMKIIMNDSLKNNFDLFINDTTYAKEIAKKKIGKAIKKILEDKGIHDEHLFNIIMIRKFNKENLELILKNYNKSIDRFLRMSKGKIISANKVISYCNLLEKYQNYDRFYYNTELAKKLDEEDQEIIIKNSNRNLKRILKESETIDDSSNEWDGTNLKDLLKLCKILGVFNEDKRFSQKMSMFILDNLFQDCPIKMKGNNIHSVFGDLIPKDEINYEFIKFFVQNYKELMTIEITNSGIIKRIYSVFDEISKTSTSHKASQRHKNVTVEKCLDFLNMETFGTTSDDKKLVKFLQRFYSEEESLIISKKILEQSSYAPRNIFTKINYDENNNPIYDNEKSKDLIGNKNNKYYYHWLPKQDWDNLVLGKYCNCCTHILGSGAGITRASMILDNCQNLVIKNNEGTIVAKMTIYVNRDKGYAVFNTVEQSLQIDIDNTEEEKLIYLEFMKGTYAFLKDYNKNNKKKIDTITIGTNRNNLESFFSKANILLETPNYSNYQYKVKEKVYGKYDGDSKSEQLLVYKR